MKIDPGEHGMVPGPHPCLPIALRHGQSRRTTPRAGRRAPGTKSARPKHLVPHRLPWHPTPAQLPRRPLVASPTYGKRFSCWLGLIQGRKALRTKHLRPPAQPDIRLRASTFRSRSSTGQSMRTLLRAWDRWNAKAISSAIRLSRPQQGEARPGIALTRPTPTGYTEA